MPSTATPCLTKGRYFYFCGHQSGAFLVLITLFDRLLAKKYGIVKRSEGKHIKLHYDKQMAVVPVGVLYLQYIILLLSCKLMSHRDAMFPPSPHADY